MRVTSIDLYAGDICAMSIGLRQPGDTDKHLAKAQYGLDAAEITPRFYGRGLRTGRKFYDFESGKREITLRVVLNPNYVLNEQPSDIRDDLYRSISLDRGGEVRVVLRAGGTTVAQIYGMITKFEVPHSSNVSELQMTISCENDRIFRGITEVVLDDELPATLPKIITDTTSTCPHGMYIELEVNATTNTIYIQDEQVDPDWKFTLVHPVNFLDGDIIRISSNHKDKFVTLERASVVTPIANMVVAGSFWPVMFPTSNEFWSPVEATVTWREVSYRHAFRGV